MSIHKIELTDEEVALLKEALDSHLYWQISKEDQRRDGYVNIDEDDDNATEAAEVNNLIARLEALS